MPHPTEKEAAKEEQPDGYHQFVEIHGPQLLNSGVPDFYWPKLYEKLSNEVKCIKCIACMILLVDLLAKRYISGIMNSRYLRQGSNLSNQDTACQLFLYW